MFNVPSAYVSVHMLQFVGRMKETKPRGWTNNPHILASYMSDTLEDEGRKTETTWPKQIALSYHGSSHARLD